MRIKNETADETFPINMTNMIDVMLVLIIFFLVATHFAQEERESKIQLPGTASIRPLSAPPKDFVINILQDGQIRVAGEGLTGQQLSQKLFEATRKDPERNVLIRADERSIMKYFAGVAALCRSAGVSELKIGYVLENPSLKPAG